MKKKVEKLKELKKLKRTLVCHFKTTVSATIHA